MLPFRNGNIIVSMKIRRWSPVKDTVTSFGIVRCSISTLSYFQGRKQFYFKMNHTIALAVASFCKNSLQEQSKQVPYFK